MHGLWVSCSWILRLRLKGWGLRLGIGLFSGRRLRLRKGRRDFLWRLRRRPCFFSFAFTWWIYFSIYVWYFLVFFCCAFKLLTTSCERNNPVAKKSLCTKNLQPDYFLATVLFCSSQVVRVTNWITWIAVWKRKKCFLWKSSYHTSKSIKVPPSPIPHLATIYGNDNMSSNEKEQI